MIRSTPFVALSLGALVLAACNMQDQSPARPQPPAPPPAATTTAATSVLQGGAQTVAALDTTTAAEKAAAAAPATGGGKLGSTVASLGDATEGGFWIKTPLVKAAAKGRVVNPANGKSANVDLQPLAGGGAGSQLSLAAMQALGVSLTDLPDIEVWQN